LTLPARRADIRGGHSLLLAISYRAGDASGTEIPGGFAHVFNNDGLCKRRPHALRDYAPDSIVGPPAAKGTTIVMGRVGYACAIALPACANAAAMASDARSILWACISLSLH